MADWISVKDRLPEVCRHVLTYDGDDIREGYLTKQGRWMRRWNGASVAITHWMPLPPLPEPSGEDKKRTCKHSCVIDYVCLVCGMNFREVK